jgi:hypothetical protein
MFIFSHVIPSLKLSGVDSLAVFIQNPDGVMKLKKLQKLVVKELQECGVTEDKEGLRATLMDKVMATKQI